MYLSTTALFYIHVQNLANHRSGFFIRNEEIMILALMDVYRYISQPTLTMRFWDIRGREGH